LRCVLDTNVLVSALLLPDSKPRHALELALQKGRVLLSFATLAELYEVLGRKKFLRYIDEEDIRSFLSALTRDAEWLKLKCELRFAAIRRTTSSSNWL
jgi:predicted nucleic acid-binding protein